MENRATVEEHLKLHREDFGDGVLRDTTLQEDDTPIGVVAITSDEDNTVAIYNMVYHLGLGMRFMDPTATSVEDMTENGKDDPEGPVMLGIVGDIHNSPEGLVAVAWGVDAARTFLDALDKLLERQRDE